MHLCPGLQFQVLYLYPDSQRITAGQSMVFRLYASCIDPYSSLHSTLDWTLAGYSSDATSRLKLRRYRTVYPSCRLAAAGRIGCIRPVLHRHPHLDPLEHPKINKFNLSTMSVASGAIPFSEIRTPPNVRMCTATSLLSHLQALPFSKPHHRHIVVQCIKMQSGPCPVPAAVHQCSKVDHHTCARSRALAQSRWSLLTTDSTSDKWKPVLSLSSQRGFLEPIGNARMFRRHFSAAGAAIVLRRSPPPQNIIRTRSMYVCRLVHLESYELCKCVPVPLGLSRDACRDKCSTQDDVRRPPSQTEFNPRYVRRR